MNYIRPAGQWALGFLPSAELYVYATHLTDIFVGVLGIELGFSCFKTNTSLIDRSPQPLSDFFDLCFSGSGDGTHGSAHARQILYHWATLLGCLISISSKNRLRNAREFSCIIPIGVSMRGLTEKDSYPEHGQYHPKGPEFQVEHGKKREKVSRPLEILVFGLVFGWWAKPPYPHRGGRLSTSELWAQIAFVKNLTVWWERQQTRPPSPWSSFRSVSGLTASRTTGLLKKKRSLYFPK